MTWWHWVAASVEAMLFVILTLLWWDTLRERRDWHLRRDRAAMIVPAVAVPAAVVAVLFVPLWAVLVLIAAPAAAIIVMALAT